VISCSFPSIVLNLHCPFISGITSCMMCHSGCPPLHGSMSQLYASCPSLRISIVTACDSSQATKIFTSCPPCACPNCKNRPDFLCPYDGNTILIEVCYSFGTPNSSTRLPRAPDRWWVRSLPSHRPDRLPCHIHRPSFRAALRSLQHHAIASAAPFGLSNRPRSIPPTYPSGHYWLLPVSCHASTSRSIQFP